MRYFFSFLFFFSSFAYSAVDPEMVGCTVYNVYPDVGRNMNLCTTTAKPSQDCQPHGSSGAIQCDFICPEGTTKQLNPDTDKFECATDGECTQGDLSQECRVPCKAISCGQDRTFFVGHGQSCPAIPPSSCDESPDPEPSEPIVTESDGKKDPPKAPQNPPKPHRITTVSPLIYPRVRSAVVVLAVLVVLVVLKLTPQGKTLPEQ